MQERAYESHPAWFSICIRCLYIYNIQSVRAYVAGAATWCCVTACGYPLGCKCSCQYCMPWKSMKDHESMWDVGHPHLHLAWTRQFPIKDIKVKWLEVIKPTCCRRPCPSDCKKGSTMRLEKAGFPSLVVKKVTWGSPTARFLKKTHDLKWPHEEKNSQF